MELTLKITGKLEARLRSRKAQLAEILELGLAAIEERPLTPEELVAYSRRELDPEAREAVAERLALDEAAVDDLLDLEHFDHLEPPSAEYRLSDGDVARALEALRGRDASSFAVDGSPSTDGGSPERPAETPAPEATIVPMPSARAAFGVKPAWLAVAAGLLIAVGIWSNELRSGRPAAAYGYPIQIMSSRMTSDVYTAPATAETIQLILDPSVLPSGAAGRLMITASDGRVVIEQGITGAENPESMLFVTLRSDQVPSGRYRVEIFEDETGERTSDPLIFTLERTPADDSLSASSPE